MDTVLRDASSGHKDKSKLRNPVQWINYKYLFLKFNKLCTNLFLPLSSAISQSLDNSIVTLDHNNADTATQAPSLLTTIPQISIPSHLPLPSTPTSHNHGGFGKQQQQHRWPQGKATVQLRLVSSPHVLPHHDHSVIPQPIDS
jgi:hypothetical protein